jgi:pyruvate formate lyase activating enzyme
MRFAINDGAGIRTTVFLKGCPLSCKWCHNPESQSYEPEVSYSKERCVSCRSCCSACESGALQWTDGPVRDRSLCTLCEKCMEACPADARKLIGKKITVQDLMEVVRRDCVFFEESGGGVTFSGGEPLSQAEFLEDALSACKSIGLSTAVDTSGYASASVLSRIAKLTDEFLFDLKMMNDSKHRYYVGVSNEKIFANLALLAREHRNVTVRIPLIPEVNDDDANLDESCRFLEALHLNRLDLLPYHEIGIGKYERLGTAYPMAGTKPPSPKHVQQIAERFSKRGFVVRIGG